MARKKSDKTFGLELITEIKKKRIGTKLDWSANEFTEALREILQKTKTFKTISNQRKSYLLVKYSYARGRKFKCIYLVSENGSEIPLTKKKFEKCFEVRSSTPKRSQIIEMLRKIIQPQIDQFRIDFKTELAQLSLKNEPQKVDKKLKCPITGQTLKNKNHVDHHPISFMELADDWLESLEIYDSYTDLPVKSTRQGLKLPIDVETDWFDYHLNKAKLRLTSAGGNLSKNSEGYRSRFKN